MERGVSVMNFFQTCVKGTSHILPVKQKRRYVDDHSTIKCKCKGSDYDAEMSSYNLGDICSKCNSSFKYAKSWHYICPECHKELV